MRVLQRLIIALYVFIYVRLLPNTKTPKNLPQHLICRYFAGNLSQIVHTLADILGNQVAGEVVFQALSYPLN